MSDTFSDLWELRRLRCQRAEVAATIAREQEQIRHIEEQDEAVSSRIRRAAKAAGVTEQDIFDGPEGSIWSLAGGRVEEKPLKRCLAFPDTDEPERAPSDLPVIPAEYNPTPEIAETVRPEKAAYVQVITSGTSS